MRSGVQRTKLLRPGHDFFSFLARIIFICSMAVGVAAPFPVVPDNREWRAKGTFLTCNIILWSKVWGGGGGAWQENTLTFKNGINDEGRAAKKKTVFFVLKFNFLAWRLARNQPTNRRRRRQQTVTQKLRTSPFYCRPGVVVVVPPAAIKTVVAIKFHHRSAASRSQNWRGLPLAVRRRRGSWMREAKGEQPGSDFRLARKIAAAAAFSSIRPTIRPLPTTKASSWFRAKEKRRLETTSVGRQRKLQDWNSSLRITAIRSDLMTIRRRRRSREGKSRTQRNKEVNFFLQVVVLLLGNVDTINHIMFFITLYRWCERLRCPRWGSPGSPRIPPDSRSRSNLLWRPWRSNIPRRSSKAKMNLRRNPTIGVFVPGKCADWRWLPRRPDPPPQRANWPRWTETLHHLNVIQSGAKD